MTPTRLVLTAVIGIAFAAFVINRQVRQRRVTRAGLVILPAWCLVLAVLVDHRMVERLGTPVAVGFFALGVGFAVAMGFARSRTLRVWSAPDGPRCEGGWQTGALWVATIAVRVALFVLAARLGAGEGEGEAAVFIGVTIAVQNLIIARRAGLLRRVSSETPVAEQLG
jgi:hypothetical protein